MARVVPIWPGRCPLGKVRSAPSGPAGGPLPAPCGQRLNAAPESLLLLPLLLTLPLLDIAGRLLLLMLMSDLT